jgi:hypothetical protein
MGASKPEHYTLAAFVGTAVGFVFGLFSSVLLDWLKRRQERQRLINLFLAELRRVHLELDNKKSAPVGVSVTRLKCELFEVSGVAFTGKPEYKLSVFNTKLFENEGVKLAQAVGPDARNKFWVAYGRLRDAEEIRLVLKDLPTADPDYQEYQKVFVELIMRASKALGDLWYALQKERSVIEDLRDMASSS